jgi:TonB family protein
MRRWTDVAIALTIAAVVSIPMRAVDSLNAARDLYAAAEYEEALTLLNRMQPGAHEPDERRAIEQYRAYCLLALGRAADAEQAMAAMVTATPLYKPSGADVSPRVRSTFTEVRRRVLPSIIQEKYAAAKLAFDRKNFALAAAAFGEVVDAMADPDVADVVKQAPLADLRTLAVGFRDLSASAATPTPLAAHPSGSAITMPIGRTTMRIYAAQDVNVSPPVAVRQALPPFPATLAIARAGVLEIVIDQAGGVESVVMRESVNPRYDEQVLAAARSWRYKPATVQGVPVKYRKMLQVTVKR